jgi:ribose/xylose/arabinose/galactoside ABC-type transport system permease subunit
MSSGKGSRGAADRGFAWLANNMVFVGLVLLVVFFSLRNPLFFSLANARSILRQLAPVGIYAFPVALLIITRSIDLSLGAVVGLSAVVGIAVMNAAGIAAGIAAFLGVGLAAGALNGVLVSYTRLNPIIVTLGTQIVFRGLSLSVSGGQAGVPPGRFLHALRTELFGFRPEAFLLVMALAVCWWMLHRNRFGRSLYAAGENERVAFLMGVNVPRLRFVMHCIVGLTGGVVGLVSVAKLGLATGGMGESMTLPVIIAVLLGGIDFGGGSGRIPGVIFGVFFVGVLEAGLLILGVTEFLQQVIVGAVLIIAIYLSTLKRRRAFQT